MGVGTGVGTGVGVGVGNGVGVGVGVGTGVGVGVGTGVRVGVGVGTGVDVGTGVGTGIGVGVGDGKVVDVGLGLGVGVGAAVAAGSGVGLGVPVGSGWVHDTATRNSKRKMPTNVTLRKLEPPCGIGVGYLPQSPIPEGQPCKGARGQPLEKAYPMGVIIGTFDCGVTTLTWRLAGINWSGA